MRNIISGAVIAVIWINSVCTGKLLKKRGSWSRDAQVTVVTLAANEASAGFQPKAAPKNCFLSLCWLPTKINEIFHPNQAKQGAWVTRLLLKGACFLRKKRFYRNNNILNSIFIRKILWAQSVWMKAQHHFWSSQQKAQCFDLDKALQPSKDLLEKSGFFNQAGMAKLISDRIFFFFFSLIS